LCSPLLFVRHDHVVDLFSLNVLAGLRRRHRLAVSRDRNPGRHRRLACRNMAAPGRVSTYNKTRPSGDQDDGMSVVFAVISRSIGPLLLTGIEAR